jgi:hypothetical protein
MIITLTRANFSACNIGTLTTVNVKSTVSGTCANVVIKMPNVEKAGYTTATTIATISLNTTNYKDHNVKVMMGSADVTSTWYSSGNVIVPANTPITSNITISVSATAVSGGDPIIPDEPEQPGTGGGSGETTEEYIINFDFTQNNLNDYSLDGTFEIPTNSTISEITYGAQGMNLNNNLPNGLILTTPVDSSKAWTLEFTGTFVKPTVLAGNRRAFLGGDNLTPFVFMNGNTMETMAFQVSAGSHVYTSASNMIWDSEVTYKFIYNGSGSLELYVNNELKETKAINYTGNFVRILGNIEGKSSAYVWQDVESGKQSWLKTFKFKYND